MRFASESSSLLTTGKQGQSLADTTADPSEPRVDHVLESLHLKTFVTVNVTSTLSVTNSKPNSSDPSSILELFSAIPKNVSLIPASGFFGRHDLDVSENND